MATNQNFIAITIKAALPAGKTLDEQFAALSIVKTAHETGDYAPLLAAAQDVQIRTEAKTRRVEEHPGIPHPAAPEPATEELPAFPDAPADLSDPDFGDLDQPDPAFTDDVIQPAQEDFELAAEPAPKKSR